MQINKSYCFIMAEPGELPPSKPSSGLPPDLTASFKEAGEAVQPEEGFGKKGRGVIETIKHLTDNIHIGQGLSGAWERVSGRIPSSEELGRLKDKLTSRLADAKILGQSVPEIFAGVAVGGVARETARLALSIAGLGGYPIAAGAGAFAGGVTGGYREYIRQRREGIPIEEDTESAGIRTKLKNEFRRLQASDKTKLRNAALKGAAFGAVGGIAGGVIADALRVGLENISLPAVSLPQVELPKMPEVNIQAPEFVQEAGKTIAGAAQEVGKTAAGVAQTVRERFPGQPPAEVTATPEAAPTATVTPLAPTETPTPMPTETVTPTAEALQPTVTPTPETPTPTPTPTEITQPPGVPSPMEQIPEQITTPKVESVTLEAGSDPWTKMLSYLTENLGRPPQVFEVRQAVTIALSENNILDATKIPVGTELNITGVNQLVGQILAEIPQIPVDLAASPEEILLPSGSSPWNEVSNYLEDVLGRKPTSAETLKVAKEVCRQSKIAVPDWGIEGNFPRTNLPSNFPLIFNQPVKSIVGEMVG